MPKEPFQSKFSRMNEDPYNELVEKAHDDGKILIGYTCSYVPSVLLDAFGLIPVRLRAPGVAGTEIADIYLSSVICSYTRSILEFALDDRYHFLGGWVFASSCDHLRRLYDNLDYLQKPDFNHILDVPHRTGDTALKWFTDELNIFRDKIQSHFDLHITEEDISEAISRHNNICELIRSIGDLRKEKHPKIKGHEFHNLITALITSPQGMLTEDIKDYKKHLDEKEGHSDYRARFLLVGGQMDDPEYIRTIENTGGLVVADHLCTGSIPGFRPIQRKSDPISDISEHYLMKTSCPRMMEDFDKRLESIVRTFSEYDADGIIIEYVKFCDTWGVESSPMVAAIRERGIPVLCLDREYRFSAEGQLRTRIQAFLESIGK